MNHHGPAKMSHVNHHEPLTLNQAAAAAGVSRSTIKRRLPELEKAGAYRLPSGEWRIPHDVLTVLDSGSHGSTNEPREPGSEPSSEPREPALSEPHEPAEPRPYGALTTELDESRQALAEARLEAAEWRARAEERADRITELATRAEAAEARLDRMITSQTALALTLKEQQQITPAATPASTTGPVFPEAADIPTGPTSSPSADTAEADRSRATTPVSEPRPTAGERFRAWRANRRTR